MEAKPGTSQLESRRLTNPKMFALLFLLVLFDGGDVAALGLTLPRISREFGLSPSQAGTIASSGMIGMLFGAIIGGRLSDKFGVKSLLIASTFTFAFFSMLTALATTFNHLVATRTLAGLGMGGLYPLAIALARDCAAPPFRSTAISIIMASATLGGVIFGFIALVPDWRLVFIVGGLCPIALLPFLTIGGVFPRSHSDEKNQGEKAVSWGMLFGKPYRGGTILIWATCFFTTMTLYIMINWLPSLMEMRESGIIGASFAAILFSLGGACGNIVAGSLVDRGHASFTYACGYIGALLAVTVISFPVPEPVVASAIFLCGFCLLGAQVVTYALTPNFYPSNIRNTGLGAMVSSGRLGSIVGPLFVGAMLQGGTSASGVFVALVPVTAIALAAALSFQKKLTRDRSMPGALGAHG